MKIFTVKHYQERRARKYIVRKNGKFLRII